MTSSTFTPYTYFQCPCDSSIPSCKIDEERPKSADGSSDDDRAFDPRAPRANYNLYPLEHLLYCEDCHQIRCPRCVSEEIVTWYCPNCLFEVPSSTVKTEGNRCTRSCFQCPICIAPLAVSSVEPPPEGLGADQATQNGPYVLFCSFCTWSSSEIGIQFEKPQGIHTQLSKINNGGGPILTARERRKDRETRGRDFSGAAIIDGNEDLVSSQTLDLDEKLDAESQFSNLKSFYQSQLAESSPVSALGLGADYGYGSPGALSRIMGLYTGGSMIDKKSKSKSGTMREASSAVEGLQLTPPSSDQSAINTLRTAGWDKTCSHAQTLSQPNNTAQFLNDLRPIAYLLRTKRSKRCRTCRHILSKPESKVQTTRFRIRLVAQNYVPSLTIRPLQPTQAPSSLLSPLKPTQFLLTFKNPLFEGVKVTLGTPSKTPGRFQSKVIILCPQFEVGANTDAWEEALGGSGNGNEKRRTKAEASEGQAQAEAGKVWERGRNWVSVVVEVIPASLNTQVPKLLKQEGGHEGPVREDEDVLEIPVFVRVDWETDAGGDDVKDVGKGEREKRELAYWCVLGLGRIARD